MNYSLGRYPMPYVDYQKSYSDIGRSVGKAVQQMSKIPQAIAEDRKRREEYEELKKKLSDNKTANARILAEVKQSYNSIGLDLPKDVENHIMSMSSFEERLNKLREFKMQIDKYNKLKERGVKVSFAPSFGLKNETWEKDHVTRDLRRHLNSIRGQDMRAAQLKSEYQDMFKGTALKEEFDAMVKERQELESGEQAQKAMRGGYYVDPQTGTPMSEEEGQELEQLGRDINAEEFAPKKLKPAQTREEYVRRRSTLDPRYAAEHGAEGLQSEEEQAGIKYKEAQAGAQEALAEKRRSWAQIEREKQRVRSRELRDKYQDNRFEEMDELRDDQRSLRNTKIRNQNLIRALNKAIDKAAENKYIGQIIENDLQKYGYGGDKDKDSLQESLLAAQSAQDDIEADIAFLKEQEKIMKQNRDVGGAEAATMVEERGGTDVQYMPQARKIYEKIEADSGYSPGLDEARTNANLIEWLGDMGMAMDEGQINAAIEEAKRTEGITDAQARIMIIARALRENRLSERQ